MKLKLSLLVMTAFVSLTSYQALAEDMSRPVYIDHPNILNQDTGFLETFTESRDINKVTFPDDKTILMHTPYTGFSKKSAGFDLNFDKNTDMVFFKEKILKNPDLEIHMSDDWVKSDTDDNHAHPVKLKNVWVKNPSNNLQINLEDLLKDRDNSMHKLESQAPKEQSSSPKPLDNYLPPAGH